MTSPRHRPGGLAWSAAAITVLLLATGFTATGVGFARLARPDRPAAARWLSVTDVQWTVTSRSGAVAAVTSAVAAAGAQVAESLPDGVRDGVDATLTAHPGAFVLGEMTATEATDGQHAASASVLVADDREVLEAIGDIGLGGPVRWDPAREVLPGDPAAGQRWSGSGAVVLAGAAVYDYRLDGAVTGVDVQGCAATEMRLRLAPTPQGTAYGLGSVDVTQQVRWCPGRGVVSAQAPGTGIATTQVDAARARVLVDGFASRPDPAVPTPAGNPVELLARPLGSQVAADPVVVTSGSRVLALDADRTRQGVLAMDGQARAAWRLLSADPVFCSPAAGAGLVAVADTGGRVVVVDAGTGVARWTVRLGFVPARLLLAAADALLVVADRTGGLYAFRLADGTPAFTAAGGGGDTLGLTLAADGRALLVATTAGVRQVGADGVPAWSRAAALSAGPTTVGDTVVVGRADGGLLALAGADGATRWTAALWTAPVDTVLALPGGGRPLLAVTGAVAGRTDLLSPTGTLLAARDGNPTAVAPVPDPAQAGGAVVAVTDRADRVDLLDARGGLVRSLAVPRTSLTHPDGRAEGALRSAAVVRGSTVWVAGNGGLLEYELTR